MRFGRFSALLLLLSLHVMTARAQAPGVYAITGGTVHPVSGPDIPNGVVIVRNGLIEAVGANVTLPADATTIDATGMHVYPGLIDAQTSLGFTAPKRGERGAEPTADLLAIRSAAISDDDAAAKRATGVTTVVTVPTAGVFNGQSVVLNLGRGTADANAVKSPAAEQISFNTRPYGVYPDSPMGVVSYIRQTFLDAQQHAAARELYERSPAGLKRPSDSPALEALRPVLRRELPVVFVVDSPSEIRRAQAIAKEMNLRYAIAGARQAYAMADELKGVPVFVSVKWPAAPADKEDRDDQPLRLIRERQLSPTTPAALLKSGVQFALVSGSGKAGDFIPGIRKAIDGGLSADDALRATTLWPSRLLGVDRQLGSIERGKIANVVLTDKPIFAKEAKVKRVFVDGREIRLPADDKAADKKDAAVGATAGASSIDGTWSFTVVTSQGSVAVSMTLKVVGEQVSGTYSGDAGSGNVNGTFDGTMFVIAIAATTQGDTSEWVFYGTVDRDTAKGTVNTTLGNFPFSGKKGN